MRIIELEKSFGDFGISVRDYEFEPGLIHGLIGPNGCGKTTLAKLIVGVTKADKMDRDFGGLGERDITMTSQRPYIMLDTVYNNLVYPLRLRGIDSDTARWLALCGLVGKEKDFARGLSSGQRQKLSIARALIFGPKLAIIDESLSNLDLDSIELFEQEILSIQKASPITWIIISHQMSIISNLCDRVHFMNEGRILLSESPGEFLENPQDPTLARFLRLSL
jgi:ABC-type multidrug transport system ATPase subunit